MNFCSTDARWRSTRLLVATIALLIMGSVAEVSAQAFPEARKTPTPFSHLEVAPLSVSFKLIDLDKSTASESKTFLVKNTGTASLNIDVGAPSESVFTITNGLGHTVIEPKGAPLSVSVLFAPRTADVYKDSISITSDATRGKNSAAVKLDGRAKGAIPTATSTHTPTPSSTPTPSRTATSTSTPTASSTATGTSTPTGTFTATPSPSATATGTSTATPTAVPTPTINLTATGTPVTVTPTPTSTPTPASFFNGSVAVNGAPVSGATINFYAVGNTGYRSAADSLGTTSTAGDGTYTVGYTCPSDGIETYAVAVGGDAGNGANSAIGLMAPVGPCGSIVQSSTKVVIDELTTAAAQVALAQFVDSTGEMVGVSATNAGGLTLGYTNYYNLAGVDSAGDFSVNGLASSFLPSVGNCPSDSTPNCDGLERLNTLSNIIAACARSSGPASQPCSDLFTGTSSSGTTLAAIHAVAINPTLNVAAVFAIQSAISTPPYQPALSSAPDGFEIGLRLAPADAGLGANTALAIDSMGDLFVISLQDLAQTQAVSEIISASGYSDGASFAPGITLADGASIAIDTNNNLFVTSRDSDAVSELLALNDYSAFSVFSPGEAAALDNPQSIALDAAGNLFVANNPAGDTTGSVSELIALGNYSTGFNYTSQDANLTCPVSLVLDFAGDIFVANCDGTVSELTVASSYHSGASFNVDLAADNGVAAVESAIGLDTDANVLVLTSGIASGGVSENTAASFYHSNQFFSPEDAAFNAPSAMTLDSGGNLFAINVDDAGWHLSELTAASAYAEGLAFSPQGANFCAPDALAVDAAGNVFVANQCQTGVGATPVVSELLGLAAPVLTPTQACLQLGQNACLP